MPDISNYYSGGSALKASDVGDTLTATIEAWRKQKFDDGKESYFLKLKGQEKEFRVNKTNAKRIAKMFGSDIDQWVGKEITIDPDVTEYQGNMVDTLVVRFKRARPKQEEYDERNPPPNDGGEIPF